MLWVPQGWHAHFMPFFWSPCYLKWQTASSRRKWRWFCCGPDYYGVWASESSQFSCFWNYWFLMKFSWTQSSYNWLLGDWVARPVLCRLFKPWHPYAKCLHWGCMRPLGRPLGSLLIQEKRNSSVGGKSPSGSAVCTRICLRAEGPTLWGGG